MASTVWKGHLTFGLVSLPVRLYSAARGETVSFNLLHAKDNSRIKQVTFCQAEDKPVPRSELVKGYEYEKDHYVVIDEEDIKKVAPKTAKVMEILEFVKGDTVDPIYLESSYYMAPDGGGEKPYALLFEAHGAVELLRAGEDRHAQSRAHRDPAAGQEGHPAAHHVSMPGRDPAGGRIPHRHRPGEAQELAMANMLIDTLKADFEPEKYHDTYRDNLMQMIEAKKEGQKVVETPEPHDGAGDRHHGSAEAQPGGEEEAGAGGHGGGGGGAGRSACQPAAKKRERRSQGDVRWGDAASHRTFCRCIYGIRQQRDAGDDKLAERAIGSDGSFRWVCSARKLTQPSSH